MKRIRFTIKELGIINRMAAIASASEWGEGDYQDWEESTSKPFDSLRKKVWALLERDAERNVLADEAKMQTKEPWEEKWGVAE